MALNNIGDAGQIKRKVYQRRLPENPNKDYYYIIRETGNAEPLLVEYGFIDNARDAQKLKNNLTDYVEGVVKAIADYSGVPYTKEPSANDFYIVQKGDTLYSIAQKFNLTVSELRDLNNLKSDMLQIGQRLLISKSGGGTTTVYKVQKGDTLYSIANQYNTTVNEIKLLNNLTNNTLTIGQDLIIPLPSTKPETPPITPVPPETIPEEEYIIYEVKKGDSLWKIARDNNITVDDLIKLNNLTNLTLQIGDKLKIPTPGNENIPTTYIVKSGDTLWSVAKAHNVDVDSLKKANNLTSNLLSIGQELIIP